MFSSISLSCNYLLIFIIIGNYDSRLHIHLIVNRQVHNGSDSKWWHKQVLSEHSGDCFDIAN